MGQIFRRWGSAIANGDTVGLASQMAFEFVFLLAPGTLFLAALLGLLGTDPATLRAIVELLKGFLPSSLHGILDQQIAAIILTGSSGTVFFWGMVLAFYLGITFISTVSHALNRGHGVARPRSWLGRQLISLLLMFWFGFTIFFAFNALVFGDKLAENMEAVWHLSLPIQAWIVFLKYPVVLASLIVMSLALYLLTPDVYQTTREALPGAFFFSIGWLLVTQLFRVYVEGFAHYTQLYLALASFIILMLWTWITSFLLLVGGTLNAVLRDLKTPAAEPAPAPPLQLA